MNFKILESLYLMMLRCTKYIRLYPYDVKKRLNNEIYYIVNDIKRFLHKVSSRR